jgi:hypothetical protein
MKYIESLPSAQPEQAATDIHLTQGEGESYRRPQVYDLGTANDLIRRSITGRLRDGNGGWWVYNS